MKNRLFLDRVRESGLEINKIKLIMYSYLVSSTKDKIMTHTEVIKA